MSDLSPSANLFTGPGLFIGTDVASFSPLDLPSLVVWLDASQVAGIADGGAVSQWDDLSGNGYHVSQATATARPTFRLAAQNGLPTLDFDGGDYLQNTSVRTTNATDGSVTAFAVFKPDVVTGGVRMLVSNDSGSGGAGVQGPQLLRQNNAALETVRQVTGGTDASGVTLSASAWYIAEALHQTGSVEAFVNGTGNGAVTPASIGTPGAQIFRVGSYSGSLNLDGMLAEVIVCSTALSATVRTEVRSYLTDKWGL